MAKRRFNLRRVKIAAIIPVGALASLDALVAAISSTSDDQFTIVSAKLSYTWTDIAAIIDDGLQFGLCHGDYSSAEVEESLEASGNIDLGDMIAREQGNRLVRQVGVISGIQGAGSAGQGRGFDNGKIQHTKLNWKISAGVALNLFIRNASGVVWTTGSSVSVTGDLWIRDRT